MPFEVLPAAEALATLEAVVGLFSGVNSLVLLQVSGLDEAAAAHLAAVRFLSGVTPLVDPKVPHSTERLPTHLMVQILFHIKPQNYSV